MRSGFHLLANCLNAMAVKPQIKTWKISQIFGTITLLGPVSPYT